MKRRHPLRRALPLEWGAISCNGCYLNYEIKSIATGPSTANGGNSPLCETDAAAAIRGITPGLTGCPGWSSFTDPPGAGCDYLATPIGA